MRTNRTAESASFSPEQNRLAAEHGGPSPVYRAARILAAEAAEQAGSLEGQATRSESLRNISYEMQLDRWSS